MGIFPKIQTFQNFEFTWKVKSENHKWKVLWKYINLAQNIQWTSKLKSPTWGKYNLKNPLKCVELFVKFDEIAFAWYDSALMVFPLYILGILDYHGVGNLVFFLCTCVSIMSLLWIISVFRNLNGLVSIVLL